MRRRFAATLIVLVTLGTLFIAAPYVGCMYRNHQFNSFIHVRIDRRSCRATAGAAQVPCQSVFAFEDLRSPSDIQFEGTELHKVYDSANRVFEVSGSGLLKYKQTIIKLGDEILVNGQQLSIGSGGSVRALVRTDGNVINGSCDVSW